MRTVAPNLCRLAEIALVLPVAIACCERGFSQVNMSVRTVCLLASSLVDIMVLCSCFLPVSSAVRIKTVLRNRLLASILENLLRIRLEGPSLADICRTDVWKIS